MVSGEPVPRRVTSADIARECGVSRTTVSYVLNDTPHQKISDATRERVLSSATRLGYTPSAAARTLRAGRSDIVLCLLPDWPIGPEVARTLQYLSTALAGHGLTFLTHPRSAGEFLPAHLWRAIGPAAVLGLDRFTKQENVEMRSAGIGVVSVLMADDGPHQGELAQQGIGRLQAEHLLDAGHRSIGYAWPTDERLLGFAEPRLAGVRAGCATRGAAEPMTLELTGSDDGARVAVRAWRAAGVTAVCAYNDEVAFQLLTAARAENLHVPGDLAVIGVDDIPLARHAAPPLTSVATDQQAVAEYTAEAIARALDGGAAPRPPGPGVITVVVRESA
ncbi:LacI family DNA-binding transcriptional regulator [Nakamurella flavida]|uniref:LacI family DNA-binding transcriptional regulator n=1 Tax=Nakamurella flavida TaxID=363630 RepID=A0A939C6H9_9ACTN|nr:LacI family DNA-binding transcriptional regulator [Nakamurella flavida]MBM9478094.1 LacI family DNA-binding transcriptional regulator [Nakamurella flavida]MDP9778685.1 DNA-binding LacI/PurR family transcriptional regulator [Nakamurella flavida]